jgi:hypothetical protein
MFEIGFEGIEIENQNFNPRDASLHQKKAQKGIFRDEGAAEWLKEEECCVGQLQRCAGRV